MELENIWKSQKIQPIAIISGGARGVDSLAAWYSRDNGLELIEHLPDWETYGNSAGFIRNKTIINDADFNIMFWDGKSKGTEWNINYCIKNNLKHKVIIIEAKTMEKKINIKRAKSLLR